MREAPSGRGVRGDRRRGWRARAALRAVVFGQEAAVELALATVVAGGHALIVGAPGLAKTRLAAAMGGCWGWTWGGCSSPPT
jgi:MoxR-like ATPase